MESSHSRLPSAACHPSRTHTTPKQNPLPPDSMFLRSWVKNKLNMVPSTYSKYDEGMKVIIEHIQQDFFPQYHSLVMQAFYKEFYSVGFGSGETGEKVWARWRESYRKQLQSSHRTSSVYSIADIEDVLVDSRYPGPSPFQNKNIDLVIPTGANRRLGGVNEQKKRTSASDSEVEPELLRNRDSNYWEDLTIPALPRALGRAKVVYIPPKSARNTVSIEDHQLKINPNMMESTLGRHGPTGSFRRNSLPARASLLPSSNASENIIDYVPHKETYLSSQGVVKKSEVAPDYIDSSENSLLQPLVAPLSFRKTHDDIFSPVEGTLSPQNAVETFNKRSKRYLPGEATAETDIVTFGRGTEIGFGGQISIEGTRRYRDFLGAPVIDNIFEGGRIHREENLPLGTDSPYSGGAHLPPGRKKILETKTEDHTLGISFGSYSVPVQEVHQGHGKLGARSPVQSFTASSNPNSPIMTHFVEDGMLHPPIQTQMREKFPALLGPTPSSSQEHSHMTFYELPEHGSLSSDAVSKYDPRADISHGKSRPSLDQRLRIINSAPATRNNSNEITRIHDEIDGTPSQRIVPNLLSRVSLFLPHMQFGSHDHAHDIRRRNSLHSSGLRVTREVHRESEEDFAGNPNRLAFTAHISRPRQDPVGQKSHTRGDLKKPTFLRVIQDAVNDGINIARKSPQKSTLPDVNSLRTSPRQHARVNKLEISGPMHDGNPLKNSSSESTPKILLNATPIHELAPSSLIPSQNMGEPNIMLQTLPATAPLNLPGQTKPQAVLMPWELDQTPLELMSSDNHKDTTTKIQENPHIRRPSPEVEGQPIITIDPFSQAALYSWIECSVVQACSDFLRQQQKNLSLDLLRKEVKKWNNSQVKLSTGETKSRDQPIEFMFGMGVQCKLLEGNYKTLHFSGPSSMNAITVIHAWRNIIPSFTPRTFCFPDYLILEHLRVIEKVLKLFGPAYWDNTTFEKKRSEIVKRIMETGQSQKASREAEKIQKLQRDRERAEASLLQAVGIWSTEDSPGVTAPEFNKDSKDRS